ncbi:hypothetical protein AB0D27_20775 [Streptomyces sp. NPDC048415]|uniref:hypothetical protein n=1 Tax=Streptomyces sp. NPDC048415 TaxID=3154822 RepID=UPI00342E1B80
MVWQAVSSSTARSRSSASSCRSYRRAAHRPRSSAYCSFQLLLSRRSAKNATLTLMYARVPASGYGTVSAVWNLAYDGGMGVGAVGFGALAGWTGYPWAFAVTALLMLVALVPACRDQRRTGDA